MNNSQPARMLYQWIQLLWKKNKKGQHGDEATEKLTENELENTSTNKEEKRNLIIL